MNIGTTAAEKHCSTDSKKNAENIKKRLRPVAWQAWPAESSKTVSQQLPPYTSACTFLALSSPAQQEVLMGPSFLFDKRSGEQNCLLSRKFFKGSKEENVM